jgi:two-component sensor histidine kinase
MSRIRHRLSDVMTGRSNDTMPRPPADAGEAPNDQAIAAARARLNRAGRPFRTTGGVNLLPVLALLVPFLALMIGAVLAWNAVLADANRQLARMADAAADYGGRSFDSYGLAAARVNDRLLEIAGVRGDELQALAHRQLAHLSADLRQPVVAFAVDRDGFPIAASHMPSVPRTTSLADRDFFEALREPGAPPVHISRMFIGRFDGKLFVAFSRARMRSAVAGGPAIFDGLTTISVDPNLIGDGLRRLVEKPGDTLDLVRADGESISSSAPHEAPLPPMPAGSPFLALAAAGAVADTFRSDNPAAGGRMLVAMRRVDGFPAYAVAARSMAALRAQWLRGLAPHLLFGIPATAALFILSLRVRRETLLLQDANAALQRDIDSKADRLRRAERYALVGTFEVDLRSGASFRSPEYLSLHGLPPRAAREAHADWVKRLHPDDRATAEATLLLAISDDSTTTDYAQTYRIITPAGQTRWISAQGQIERDAEGRAMTLRGVHADVTTLRATEVALEESNAKLRLAQEAVDIGNWEWSPGPRKLFLSRKSIELLGWDPEGQAPGWTAMLRRIHPADRRSVSEAVGTAFTSRILRLEFRILRPRAEGGSDTVWLMARARALRLGSGAGQHLVGIAYDISDRKLAEERASILAREVEHRSKNLITLVLGIVRMTEAPTAEALREVLDGRLLALSKTINLLSRSRWTGVGLRALAQQELAPYFHDEDVNRYLSGPDIQLGPDVAQPVSMALHELATNAAKYGALSVDSGTVSLSWSQLGGTLRLVWQERGGPPLAGPPEREGFGSALIDSAITGQLQGSLVRLWDADGLRCEISIPAQHPSPGE